MQLFQDVLDQSKQLNQTPSDRVPIYHAPNKKYKLIRQALIIPDLPAPLHYLNFISLIGQPNLPIFRHADKLSTTALDTATTFASTSAHMVGQFSHYSIAKDCFFNSSQFKFAQKESVIGTAPEFQIQRIDSELSFQIKVVITSLISYLSKLRFGLAEHWSAVCECRGEVQYKGQDYEIAQIGAFEYARSKNFNPLPIAFFTYQIINLQGQRQLLLQHMRDSFNRIIQSRIYLRDFSQQKIYLFDQGVHFYIQRIYPAVRTPHGQKMYLPREFEWSYHDTKGHHIHIYAQSRGDFKFGLGAGYVGSYKYQIQINGEEEQGENGYCEYIDCRPLNWQEDHAQEQNIQQMSEIVPISLRK